VSHDEEFHGHGPSADDPYAHATERKKRRRKKRYAMPGGEITELNLTPMMDMMTILLVYLLGSQASEAGKINVDDHLRPPESVSEEIVKPAVTVTVTDQEILVDSVQVKTMAELIGAGGPQVYINELVDALTVKAEDLKKLETLGGPPFDGSVLIVAHRSTPYNILSSVLYSAGRAQYGRFRLVVMKEPKK
jgi:biopolymer transport protein ExbD